MKYQNFLPCLSNDHCVSGYCRKGTCQNPEKKHDPCLPSTDNCPKNLWCSDKSRTCVPVGYKPLQNCITASDCKFNEYCLKGECKANIAIGKICEVIRPDLCAMGSKCTVSLSSKEATKCYELCSDQISCPSGFKCTENIWNADPICIPNKFKLPDETVQAVIIVLAVVIFLLGIIYGWVRITKSGRDPRLLSSSGKKKKKKYRLNYEGNGLATITVIPSNCQSPQPVAASQLFNSPVDDAPPAYSEVINIR